MGKVQKTYIVTSLENRGLYYYRATGRGRIYRHSLIKPPRGAVLLTYKSIEYAKSICSTINEKYGEGFSVREQIC